MFTRRSWKTVTCEKSVEKWIIWHYESKNWDILWIEYVRTENLVRRSDKHCMSTLQISLGKTFHVTLMHSKIQAHKMTSFELLWLQSLRNHFLTCTSHFFASWDVLRKKIKRRSPPTNLWNNWSFDNVRRTYKVKSWLPL